MPTKKELEATIAKLSALVGAKVAVTDAEVPATDLLEALTAAQEPELPPVSVDVDQFGRLVIAGLYPRKLVSLNQQAIDRFVEHAEQIQEEAGVLMAKNRRLINVEQDYSIGTQAARFGRWLEYQSYRGRKVSAQTVLRRISGLVTDSAKPGQPRKFTEDEVKQVIQAGMAKEAAMAPKAGRRPASLEASLGQDEAEEAFDPANYV